MYSYIWRKGREVKALPEFSSKYKIKSVLPLLWLEHCVECAAPLCYKTCAMYKPRSDKRCLRFEGGVHPIYFLDFLLPGAQITFRRWAKLESAIPSNFYGINMVRLELVCRLANNWGLIIEKALKFIPWSWHRPSRVVESLLSIYLQKKLFQNKNSIDGFLLTIFNHGERRKILLEITEEGNSIYKTSFVLYNGWNEYFTPITDFSINPKKHTLIKLFLEGDDDATLSIKHLDFVSLIDDATVRSLVPANKVKCVAWDLDNTLWNGVIGDAGEEGVSLNMDCIKLIKELDKRGIIQTIVSKNTFDIAWKKIKQCCLDEYFLYPAINWGRKSQSLLAISKELNINIDTFAVIDDSVFERNEIAMTLPQVRAYDVSEVGSILSKPEFDIPITIESARRRISYLNEKNRKTIKASWEGDYDSFLIECSMVLTLVTPKIQDEKIRCLELLQRSNQYNISKERRTEEAFYNLFLCSDVDTYAFQLSDRFGDYGIVGFSSFRKENREYHLIDFVMSCRVAQKKVERAFFSWIVNTLDDGEILKIKVFKTERNMPLRKELLAMPFDVKDDDKFVEFTFMKGERLFVNDNIITVNS